MEPLADNQDLKTLLILDRESVAAAEGVTFHLNPAQKRPENPVLLPGEPHQWDGLQVCWPGTVLYDAEEKLFRCWYHGLDPVQKDRPPIPWLPGYAESRDGVHWTKPDLGQHAHQGRPTNRIVPDWGEDATLGLVVKNPDQSNPQRRFLALGTLTDETGLHKALASSPDGKAWKSEGIAFTPAGEERINFIDVSSVIFQPEATEEHDRFWAYGQVFRPRAGDGRVVRQIGLARGPHIGDFQLAGATDEEFIVLAPEAGLDEELHFATVSKIGDLFVMLFESDCFSTTPLHGDLRLAVSQDGRQFRRVHPQTPLVATGARGMWDENLLVVTTSALQEVGDELWIYYFGCPNVFTRWPGPYAVDDTSRGSFYYPTYLGVATLPRDRFAYAAGPGSVTTSELALGPGGLWLNAEGDQLAVTALDAAGAVLGEGRVGPGPALYRPVEWTTPPPVGPGQLRVELNAGERLYSVRY